MTKPRYRIEGFTQIVMLNAAFVIALLSVLAFAGPSHTHPRRDPAVRARFMREHPCPSTGRKYGACPGYVVDHIKALKRGGADAVGNMQWQTVTAAKAKDRIE